jgi:hypothetical protein
MKTSFSINVDFDEIDIDDFIEYLEDKGYRIDEPESEEEEEEVEQTVKSLSQTLRTKDDDFVRDLIYEYLGMGHFNDWSAVCDELKARLGK